MKFLWFFIMVQFYFKRISQQVAGKFECLWENTKKSQTFSIPIEKEVAKIDKNDNENVLTISYKIKFIDRARILETSL